MQWRFRWLGHPVLAVCFTVLVINDHYLKSHYPGWWTGKLSDVAGVCVVAIVAAVLVGRRSGLLATAVGFLVLKTVPGAAELARPVLGGVTSRDASDLLALLALAPLALWMRPMDLDVPTAVDSAPPTAARTQGPGAGWPLLRSVLVPVGRVLMLAAVAGSVSATSCGPDAAVLEVTGDGDAFFAQVDRGWGDTRWARSDDGGRTWSRSPAPPGRLASVPSEDAYEDPGSIGPAEACWGQGTCFRIVNRRVIERREPGADWSEDFRLSDGEFDDISTGCAGGQRGVLASLTTTKVNGRPSVVASLGADGVLIRVAEGRWTRRGVLDTPAPEQTSLDRAAGIGSLAFAVAAPLAVWLVGRGRWPSVRRGVVAAGVGGVLTLVCAGGAAMFIDGGGLPPGAMAPVVLTGFAVSAGTAVRFARRQLRHPNQPNA